MLSANSQRPHACKLLGSGGQQLDRPLGWRLGGGGGGGGAGFEGLAERCLATIWCATWQQQGSLYSQKLQIISRLLSSHNERMCREAAEQGTKSTGSWLLHPHTTPPAHTSFICMVPFATSATAYAEQKTVQGHNSLDFCVIKACPSQTCLEAVDARCWHLIPSSNQQQQYGL